MDFTSRVLGRRACINMYLCPGLTDGTGWRTHGRREAPRAAKRMLDARTTGAMRASIRVQRGSPCDAGAAFLIAGTCKKPAGGGARPSTYIVHIIIAGMKTGSHRLVATALAPSASLGSGRPGLPARRDRDALRRGAFPG